MSQEFIISLFALIFSIISILWTIISNTRQRKESAIATGFSLVTSAESLLGEIPSALKFHGIDQSELDEIGIEPKEFAYLLVSFSGAGIFYRMYSPKNSTPFPKRSYRYEMLKSPHTRAAWPILKRIINPYHGSYAKKIQATIEMIESIEKSKKNNDKGNDI